MEILRWNKIAPRAAFHAARHTRTRGQRLRYHGHDFAEMFWIDSGRGTHRINGAEVPLQAGSLVLMRPTDCHGIETDLVEGMKLTNIAFPREAFDDLGRRYFSGRAFWQTGKFPVMHQLEPGRLRRLNRWVDDLSESPRERLYLDRFLLCALTEVEGDSSDALPENAPDWLVEACRAIRKRENFSGGVERFLRLCGRSREHVARTVRQHLGTTPTRYVNAIRMRYAQRQLEMGDQGILDISLDCGVENLSHFYSLFREQTGVTPRAYRMAHHRAL